jgi:hypothetical protein
MNSLARWRLGRVIVGVLVALFTGGLLAPSKARAECGDYVIMGKHGTTGSHMSSADQPQEARHTAPAPHKPCSGPNCSRGSLPPAPVPTVPPPVRGEQWGCTSPQPLCTEPEPVTRPAENLPLHPVDPGLAIYHPPR